ncbi:hypothetical protein OG819_46120 [Streptomyces sp. NBC_01549]|uniref:hypothetical protein n=1 Tax=Streptomyces sp. NBC_01549 TaxID=2975874 RepID=UPI00225AF0AC|nr:hypothetical protein [Streptomyces sp. NBC_01549]MCX4596756.1 hypothetical protein [Streptomyces sp. NBC_01549]
MTRHIPQGLAFGRQWTAAHAEVGDWFHLHRIRASLPGMTRHTPLTWTDRSGRGSSASFTADLHELTYRRTIDTLSSPSAEVTRSVAVSTAGSTQHGLQGALGGHGGDVFGGDVLGEAITGATTTTRDGDRQRAAERVVVATKYDVTMAVFDGWVRLDGTLRGPLGTVRQSGLFPVQIAVPLSESQGSRIHDAAAAPVFTAARPSGFVPAQREARLGSAALAVGAAADTTTTDKPDKPFTASNGDGRAGAEPAAESSGAGTRDVNTADTVTSAPEAGPSGAQGAAQGSKPDLGPKVSAGPPNETKGPSSEAKDSADRGGGPSTETAARGAARPEPEPRALDWEPPARDGNPPPPPPHALASAWHPSDMLLGVDPADALLGALREDLGPALGRFAEREMRRVEEQLGLAENQHACLMLSGDSVP